MSSPAPASIQILPEEVVHKIAAGEVVERPVSVVKELVENSIDAGATQIHFQIEQGGLKSIVVCDDGHGVIPQDLPLALKRHATSKLQRAEDLFSLQTLGFRGEALPSIASVSRFTIESATADSAPLGYAVDVEAGKAGGLRETALAKGTRVTVRDLFCTTPARLKFLKRPETEWGHIADLTTALALSHLDIEWRLDHNGKKSLFCPRTDDPKKRALDLFGREVMEALYPMERKVAELGLSGLISHPNFSKKSNRNLFVFVNGRVVQDRLIQHAILTGYRGLLMTQQYPMVILNVRIDPKLVDVNVHPAKREVRFSNSNAVHHLISETIRHTLETSPWVTKSGDDPKCRGAIYGARDVANTTMFATSNEGAINGAPTIGIPTRIQAALSEFTENRPQAKIGTLNFSQLQLIGQFHQTYLICSYEGSLVLIDQHAAHERIGFEQLKKSYLSGKLAQQILLHPLSFDLPEGEAQGLRSSLTELQQFGFDVEEFGERSFVLKAHPSLLTGCNWVQVLNEVASQLQEEGRLQPLQDRVEHLLATMACHRQIRAGDSLNREEMVDLLKQLEGTPRSYHCPHGRPVMVEIEAREIERWFKRVL